MKTFLLTVVSLPVVTSLLLLACSSPSEDRSTLVDAGLGAETSECGCGDNADAADAALGQAVCFGLCKGTGPLTCQADQMLSLSEQVPRGCRGNLSAADASSQAVRLDCVTQQFCFGDGAGDGGDAGACYPAVFTANGFSIGSSGPPTVSCKR